MLLGEPMGKVANGVAIRDGDRGGIPVPVQIRVVRGSASWRRTKRRTWGLGDRSVNYVDYTLTRLADESLRAAVFDQNALAQLLSAAYDADALPLDGPFTAVFDQMFMGLTVPRRVTLEGTWGDLGSPQRREGRFTLQGFGMDSGVRVDALWRGAIVARTSSSASRIDRVVSTWPDPDGIDDQIVADLGSLPGSAVQLEAERRKRFVARVRLGMRQPEALDDPTFDRWLHSIGARDVTDLMTRFRNQLLTGAFQVAFTDPADEVPAPRPLPVSAAILVRDQPLDLAQLLADSKLVREDLEQSGAERPLTVGSVGRYAIVVVWILPENIFDDADWPGGDTGTDAADKNRKRRVAAGRWRAREGIGLVTTTRP